MDASALKLDEEQHVVTAQERGLDREEVAGDDARRLVAKELPPVGACAPGRRSGARLVEQSANGARQHDPPELGELAGNPLVAPARVLPCEPQNELASRPPNRWPARTRSGVGPLPANE